MTTVLEARDAAVARFFDLVAAPRGLEALTFVDNEREAGQEPDPTTPLWVQANFQPGASFQADIAGDGSNRSRTLGFFVVQAFAGIGSGTRDVLALAVATRDAFKQVTASGVVWETPEIIQVGRPRPNDVWFQVNIRCPFRADEV